MSTLYNYNQKMNIKYAHLELIDVPAIIAENKEKWVHQSLTTINGSVARLGIVEGEYHWYEVVSGESKVRSRIFSIFGLRVECSKESFFIKYFN
jgi:hypothetical protein